MKIIIIGAGIAGPMVLPAIAVAGLVALCNGMSSAQLAANHPVSGGTYEYGHRWLNPSLGFVAGWMFLCAKSASAATAALGALKKFDPDLICVSAGFDAYKRDPLCQQQLEPEDFTWIAQQLRALKKPQANILEGGYSNDLPKLILAYLKGLLK